MLNAGVIAAIVEKVKKTKNNHLEEKKVKKEKPKKPKNQKPKGISDHVGVIPYYRRNSEECQYCP